MQIDQYVRIKLVHRGENASCVAFIFVEGRCVVVPVCADILVNVGTCRQSVGLAAFGASWGACASKSSKPCRQVRSLAGSL